jgi:hypothetical protein
LAPFRKLAKTFRQYWGGIVSYFQCRITQGAIEAINGIIQLAKRRARGFRRTLHARPASDRLCPGKPPPLRVELGKMSEQRRCCTKETAQERLRIEP